MATRIVKINCDERYPDFDVYPVEDQWASSYAREALMTEKEYVNAIRVITEYGELQEKLGELYAKAKKSNN